MPEPEGAEQELSREEIHPETDLHPGPETEVDQGVPMPPLEWEKISSKMERFSNLSSEITAVMAEVSRSAEKAMEQLHEIRAAVDLKKSELKTLHGIEGSAEELQRWIEDRRLQIAELERLLESQRNAFDSEKSRLEQEEKKYLENLEAERKREETVYRQRWTEEGLRAKEALETELRALQQEKAEKQEALLRDLLERELRIKQKEEEWDLLTRELEQFISGLAEKACRLIQEAQSKSSVPDDSSGSNRSRGPDG